MLLWTYMRVRRNDQARFSWPIRELNSNRYSKKLQILILCPWLGPKYSNRNWTRCRKLHMLYLWKEKKKAVHKNCILTLYKQLTLSRKSAACFSLVVLLGIRLQGNVSLWNGSRERASQTWGTFRLPLPRSCPRVSFCRQSLLPLQLMLVEPVKL